MPKGLSHSASSSPASLIPHSSPTVDRVEVEAVSAVLLSGQLAQGELVSRFEQQLAKLVSRPGGVATSSGTAALHLALLALGIGPGDEVALPSFLCTAPLNAIHYVGATPLVVDIDPLTFNIDPQDLKRRLTRHTKAAIVPHTFGLPAEINAIQGLGLTVIEDCAQALLATYHGKPVGGLGTVAICSFYATKLLTTGEGGMLLASSSPLLERARDLRSYDQKEHYRVRYNYKMTELQASIGLVQLGKLPAFVEQRAGLARTYTVQLSPLPLILPHCPADRSHSFYRYVVRTQGDIMELRRFLRDHGIAAERPIYRPLHHYLGHPPLSGSEEAWKTSLSLPLYPTLSEEAMHHIIEQVGQWFNDPSQAA